MVEAMEAAAENAQAQFSNIEAAMRQQLAQFRANASSEGSLTDDVMGESPSIDHRPKSTAAPWLRTRAHVRVFCSAGRLLSRRRLERALAEGAARVPRHGVGAGRRDTQVE